VQFEDDDTGGAVAVEEGAGVGRKWIFGILTRCLEL
jgi:hypothetical protein